MENNVKDNDMLMVIVGHKEKKEFETKLNEFLKENEDMLLKNHVFFRNSLQAVPHIMNVVIPNLNDKIDEYNNDFDGQFLPVTPIVNKNSQNSFTINFTAQNKQVTYDFDEIYNKLVRDKITDIIEADGRIAKYRILDNKEYLDDNNIEELADIVEVIYGILNSMNVSINEFERIRINKQEERGAFEKKIYLEESE